MRTVYSEVNGEVKKHKPKQPLSRVDTNDLPFNQRMIAAHYALECQHGCRFRPYDHSKTKIKEVWSRDG